MLSRIAESMFWIGRYVERAEDTARLLQTHLRLIIEDTTAQESDACRNLLALMSVDHVKDPDLTDLLRILGFPGDEVAVDRVHDQAVPGQTERWGGAPLRADPGEGRRNHDEDERGNDDGAPRDTRDVDRSLCKDAHWEPPFEEGPARALPEAGGPRQHVVCVIGQARSGELGDELGKPWLDSIEARHANCPRGSSAVFGVASASNVSRIAASERCSRDLAVPTGIPSTAATSGSGSPRK